MNNIKTVLLDVDGQPCGEYVYVICDKSTINGLMRQTSWYYASEIDALQVANKNKNLYAVRIPTKNF